ncbi:hypothetical protein LTR12_017266 [Friedmanniomyces endolithicus]|nr:hypothetical protein LTR12_017266 [Friedmanniomyces endolithicus]
MLVLAGDEWDQKRAWQCPRLRKYMAKRKISYIEGAEDTPVHLRRSPRLAQKLMTYPQKQPQRRKQLPSPGPSASRPVQTNGKKRQLEPEAHQGEERRQKRARRTNICGHSPSLSPSDPVAYWAENFIWPTVEVQKQGEMKQPNSKRKNSSTHHSEKQHRLEQHGIHMRASTLLQKQSKQFCEELLEGNLEPSGCPCYPVQSIEDVLERVHGLNEARLQRDIMPWVVPSAENLFFSGIPGLDVIGEELDSEWSRCEPMGLSRPKPDFTAGLRRSAFAAEDLEKLENYGTAQQPFYFTPNLCFPFLICEAKTGRIGIDLADTQNIHSASIATKAILSLYAATFGRHHEKTKDLLGRILVFTVSHNNRIVNLYGHYAVNGATSRDNSPGEATDSFQYFRYDIAMFSLGMHDGRDRFKAYNFVRNLYDTFAPQHLERIREAARFMQKPVTRTGLSFAASDITLDEEGSQHSSEIASQEDQRFKTPSEPASASQKREKTTMKCQLDLLRQHSEQQRKESRDREEMMERQMAQQKEEHKEQQREQKEMMERQMAQQKEMMELLKLSKT